MPSTQRRGKLSLTLSGGEEMKQFVRVVLTGTFAWGLLALSPYAISPAQALPPPSPEIHLNSHKIQIVHNAFVFDLVCVAIQGLSCGSDVLNMTLNITNDGDDDGDPCDSGDDDLLESGLDIEVYSGTCASKGTEVFDYDVEPFVEHDIGSFSYGTFFGSNGLGTVAAKISEILPTEPGTCGTWSFNLQATDLDLSSIQPLQPIALVLNDEDDDAGGAPDTGACFDISDAQVGNAIVKPHQGLHHARRR